MGRGVGVAGVRIESGGAWGWGSRSDIREWYEGGGSRSENREW